MTPAQMRMARAALHWSIEQLAEAAGVHRNTVSNFETGKYAGDPETRAAIKHALETAGAVFIGKNGDPSGVKLRRFREGDLVRFRPQTRMRFDYGIPADEVGTVVQVEPHPPQTGPTYKMSVQFPSHPRPLPFVFWPEYVLVKAAPEMEFKQSTIEQILKSEHDAVLSASERYGRHYENTLMISVYLTTFLESFHQSRWVFGSFLGQVKKHQLLSLLSAVRLHKVQSMMNLRQVVEAGACAAYAIANPDHHDFVDADEDGILDPAQKLAKKRHKWLDENYPDGSKALKDIKGQLNSTTSHANLINAYSNDEKSTEEWLSSPFFDIEDPYYVKTDLWRIGNAGLTLMLYFHEINSTRKVIKFADNFPTVIDQLRSENEALRAEMMETPRFKAAMEKEATRSEKLGHV